MHHQFFNNFLLQQQNQLFHLFCFRHCTLSPSSVSDMSNCQNQQTSEEGQGAQQLKHDNNNEDNDISLKVNNSSRQKLTEFSILICLISNQVWGMASMICYAEHLCSGHTLPKPYENYQEDIFQVSIHFLNLKESH